MEGIEAAHRKQEKKNDNLGKGGKGPTALRSGQVSRK